MGKWDEICYPFTEDDSMFCDYEILSDGLSSYLGLILSIAEKKDILKNFNKIYYVYVR